MNALGIDRVQAGSINSAFALWEIRTTTGAATARWELIDEDGLVYNQGTVATLTANAHPFKADHYQFRAEASIEVPYNAPVNDLGSQYRVKWILLLGGIEHYVFDTFIVMPSIVDRTGVIDSVELLGSTVRLLAHINEPSLFECVIQVYRGNGLIMDDLLAESALTSSDGYTYFYDWDSSITTNLGASLDPLQVVFRYKVNASDSTYTTQYGNLWLVNPSILDAIRNIEQFLNAAYQDAGLQPFASLDNIALISYLRKGKDQFNAAVRPTNFTMTNAADAIRHYWLGYSMVSACRSQYLAEGMKAFNFSGAAVTLEVDRTQFWDSLASNLSSELETGIKPFKDMLNKYGIFGGDGSTITPQFGSIGSIGIRLSTLTPLRGGSYTNLRGLSW